MDYELRDEQPTINGLIVRSVDSVGGRFKDLDTRDGRHRVLVEFPHERVDTYKTTFGTQCFVRSFDERLPVMCWQHDLRDPIGRAEKAQVLRSANELTGVFSDFDKVPQAARAHSQIEDGTLQDFSFGFRDPTYERHPDFRGVRRITEATMKEFSPVTIGSIPGAVATGIREEDVMEALSIDNILRLRDAHMISDEDAQQALKNIAGLEHITVLSSTSSNGTTRETEPETPHEIACPSCEKRSMSDIPFCAGCGAKLVRDEDDLPETIGPAEVFGALPEPYQRAIAEAEARLFLVVGDEEWGPLNGTRSVDDHALELLTKIDAACRSGVEWLGEVDLDTLAPEMRQAIALFQAAGVGAEALLDVFDEDHSLRDDADMALPDQDERAVPDDAPEGSKTCPTCNGTGKIRAGHVTCPDCNGKGWLTPERANDIASTRAIPDDWSTKPWENINPSDYTPEQLKRAALVSTGDTKGDQHLPIREPDGTINVNAVQAAAGRLNQTSSISDEQKAQAANKLAGLYRQMGKDLPDNVKQYATRAAPDDDDDSEDDMADESGDGKPSGTGAAASEDTDDEDDESKRQRAMARLERHQRPRST